MITKTTGCYKRVLLLWEEFFVSLSVAQEKKMDVSGSDLFLGEKKTEDVVFLIELQIYIANSRNFL